MSNIEERVKAIIGNQIKKSPSEIQSSDDFVSLGADSLDTVELVMAFEDEFDVTIPDDEAAKLKSVADVIKFLESNSK